MSDDIENRGTERGEEEEGEEDVTDVDGDEDAEEETADPVIAQQHNQAAHEETIETVQTLQNDRETVQTLQNDITMVDMDTRQRHSTPVKSKPSRKVTFSKDANKTCCQEVHKRCNFICCIKWCKKYLWQGKYEELGINPEDSDTESLQLPRSPPPSCLYKYWTFWAFFLPCLIVHIFWWSYYIKFNFWDNFKDHYNVTITVAFGAVVASAMSWGVGAVMYPMMVLGFSITPDVTRDSILLIQAVGSVTLSASVFLLHHKVEKHAVILCSLGGASGVLLGLEKVEPVLTDDIRTVVFISSWFVFATVLFVYCFQGYRGYPTRSMITEICFCRSFGLLVVSFAGGVLTAIAGTGLQLFTFAALAVYFRISSTVAGPTSLMVGACGSVMGAYWREVIQGGLQAEAWPYFTVTVPVLVVCAPAGYIISWHFHNLLLGTLGLVITTVALVASYAVVNMTKVLVAVNICILLGGIVVLLIAGAVGVRVLIRKGLMTSTPRPKSRKKLRKKRKAKREARKKEREAEGSGEDKKKERKSSRKHFYLDYVGAEYGGDLQKPGGFFGRGWEGCDVITFKEFDANESDL